MGGLRDKHEGELEQEPLKSDDERAELFVPGRSGSNASMASQAESLRRRRNEGGGELPHLDAIQQSFGNHDVSDVRAYVGGSAKESADSIGAEAYVSEGEAAFGKSPDIHTAAHEAAHVVHQRSGRVGDSGITPEGDVHERHADQVADLVVQGQSAEHLLDQYPDAGASTEAVQCKRKAGFDDVSLADKNDAAPEGDVSGQKDFSETEKQWINEVLASPAINLFFKAYGDIPDVVLHRVTDMDGAKGTFFGSQDKIGLSDDIYGEGMMRTQHTLADGSKHVETDEEAFKGTLIHELFHYMEEHTTEMADRLPDDILRPQHLIEALYNPTSIGFGEYAFGWFVHPDEDVWLHFDVPELTQLGGAYNILGYSELLEFKRSGAYESSPMAVSGDLISAEEDMSETVSRYLVSEKTREGLRTMCPLRATLMDRFFGHLVAKGRE